MSSPASSRPPSPLIAAPPAFGRLGRVRRLHQRRRGDRPHDRRQGEEAAVRRDRVGGPVRGRTGVRAGHRAHGRASPSPAFSPGVGRPRLPEREGPLRRHAARVHEHTAAQRRPDQRRAVRQAAGSRASGRLRATVSILDDATGTEVTTCETGSLKWSASRSAGRIYARQDEAGRARRRAARPQAQAGDRPARRLGDQHVRAARSLLPHRRAVQRLRRARPGASAAHSTDSYPTDDGSAIAFAYDVSRHRLAGRYAGA